MSFLEAVVRIAASDTTWLCEDPEERDGRHPSICVNDTEVGGNFIGKIRWPNGGKVARVDVEVAEHLRRVDNFPVSFECPK